MLVSSAFPNTGPSSLSRGFLPGRYNSAFENQAKQPVIKCQDDGTYRSRHAHACYIYSLVDCSKMYEIGFSEVEVYELIRRCRRSCNTCDLTSPSSSPSYIPSRGNANLLSNTPYHVVSSNTLGSVPSSFLHSVTANVANNNTTIAADAGIWVPEKFKTQLLLIPLIFSFISIIFAVMIFMKIFKNEGSKDMKKSENKITKKRSNFMEEGGKPSYFMEEYGKGIVPNTLTGSLPTDILAEDETSSCLDDSTTLYERNERFVVISYDS